MKFYISILAMDNLPLTKRCIESVIKHSSDFELLLTNNASKDGTASYFDQLAREPSADPVRVIHFDKNRGFQEPNTIALAASEAPFFVMLNNDAEVPAGWLEKLVKPFDDPQMAIVGQRNACCSLDKNFFGFRGPRYEYVEFSCAMIRRDLAVKHGLFSNYIRFANCEDADTSLRMRELGYKIACADFSIEHAIGATRRNVPGLVEIFHRNLCACQNRWHDYLNSPDRKFPRER